MLAVFNDKTIITARKHKHDKTRRDTNFTIE